MQYTHQSVANPLQPQWWPWCSRAHSLVTNYWLVLQLLSKYGGLIVLGSKLAQSNTQSYQSYLGRAPREFGSFSPALKVFSLIRASVTDHWMNLRATFPHCIQYSPDLCGLDHLGGSDPSIPSIQSFVNVPNWWDGMGPRPFCLSFPFSTPIRKFYFFLIFTKFI